MHNCTFIQTNTGAHSDTHISKELRTKEKSKSTEHLEHGNITYIETDGIRIKLH